MADRIITKRQRWSIEESNELQHRARTHHLTESEYIRRACLGRLDINPDEQQRRLDNLEHRLIRAEETLYATSY
jgi:hypothetical protein